MKQQTADTYLGRFETFVSDVREQLGFPDLKVFSVAVTATTDRLPHLSKVRTNVHILVGIIDWYLRIFFSRKHRVTHFLFNGDS